MIHFTAPINCQECGGEGEKFYFWVNQSARRCTTTLEKCVCMRGTLRVRGPEGYTEVRGEEYDRLKEEWRKPSGGGLSQAA